METSKFRIETTIYYQEFDNKRIVQNVTQLNNNTMYTRADTIEALIDNVKDTLFIQKGKFLKKWAKDGYGSNYYYEMKIRPRPPYVKSVAI